MSRPEGRRRTFRKLTLYKSELDRLLKLCPPGDRKYQRVSYLCRAIALGEYRVRDRGETSWQAPEIQRNRDARETGTLGRTFGSRTQRDILFFAPEWACFAQYLPESEGKPVSFQAFHRGLASGRYYLEPNEEGRATQRERARLDKCSLCGGERQDAGEYCPPCRGVEIAA